MKSNTTDELCQYPIISGSGGKGGGRTPVEADDTIQSNAYANVVVALSEGEIELVPKAYLPTNCIPDGSTFNVTSHPFKNLDPVVFYGSPPSPLQVSKTYWVIYVDANNFRLATEYSAAQANSAIGGYGSQPGPSTFLAVDMRSRVYLDRTPILSPAGNVTAQIARYSANYGTNDQSPIGTNAVETVFPVGLEVKHDFPISKTIDEPNTNELLVILTFQALQRFEDNGDINGSTVQVELQLSSGGGPFVSQGVQTISQKASGSFQVSYGVATSGDGPWTIKVIRVTPDSNSAKVQDGFTFDSVTSRIYEKLRYPNTACLAIQFDAKQFNKIPDIRFVTRGRIINIPVNYDPITRVYNGLWNGRFKQQWSNNPAWILYDLLTNKRYGVGLANNQVDKWGLYRMAQFCDVLVPDGRGGMEPRYTCNVYLQNAGQAWDVIKALSDVFKSMTAYMDGHLTFLEDRDRPVTRVFTAANVLSSISNQSGSQQSGLFNYSSPSLKARHTAVAVSWDNPEYLYDPQVEYVADDAGIVKYGYNLLDLRLLGCTSRAQALRAAKWALYTEALENEVVKFKISDEAMYMRPGEIIGIVDELKNGSRCGGRILDVTHGTQYVVLTVDQIIEYQPGHNYTVTLTQTFIQDEGEGRATLNATYIWEADGTLTLNVSDGLVAAGDKIRILSQAGGTLPLASYRVVEDSPATVVAAPKPSTLGLSPSTGSLTLLVVTEALQVNTYPVNNPGLPENAIAILPTVLNFQPVKGCTWVIEDTATDVMQEYRVVKILQEEPGAYSVEAVKYHRGKLTEVEQSIVVDTLPPSITTNYVPDVPTNLAASVIFTTTSVIRASWTPPRRNNVFDPNVSTYKVQYRQTNQASWNNVPPVEGTSVDIPLGLISQGITYEVRVAAVTAFGQTSNFTASVTAMMSADYLANQAAYNMSAAGVADIGPVSGDVGLDFSLYTNVKMTLTGNIILDNPLNEVAGRMGTITFIQDNVGGHLVDYNGVWSFGTTGSVTTASSYKQSFILPTLNTAPGSSTTVRYKVNAPDNITLSAA